MSTKDTSFAELFASLTDLSSKHIPELVLKLARKGSISALEAMLHADPALPTIWPNDHPYEKMTAYAILPLAANVQSADKARAEQLISSWLTWFGADTEPKLVEQFKGTAEADVAAAMARRLAHSPAGIEAINDHLRSTIWGRLRHTVVEAVVTVTVSDGSFGPHEAALTELCKIAPDPFVFKVLSGIPARLVPASERERLAKPITRIIIDNAHQIDGEEWLTQLSLLQLWLAFLDRVDPAAEEWKALSQAWLKHPALMAVVVDGRVAADAGRVLREMADAGINIAEAEAFVEGKRDPVPLLHAAATADRASIVQLLLDCGADPDTKIKYKGKSVTASDLAPAGGQASMAISSFKARQAMGAAISARKPKADDI